MTTYQPALFFGVSVEESLKAAFQTNSAYSHYIQEGYLQEHNLYGNHYVGKQIGDKTHLEELLKLQEHIRSLIVKLSSDPSTNNLSLYLIPIRL